MSYSCLHLANIKLAPMVTCWGRCYSHCSMVLAFSWRGCKSLAHCPLCGRHTSIVVHKDEFFFGSGGISSCTPVSDFPLPADVVVAVGGGGPIA